MTTICCLCRNGSRVPPLPWVTLHHTEGMGAAKSHSWLSERNKSTHPHQITKIKTLTSIWGSRVYIWAPSKMCSQVALSSNHCMCRSCSQAPRAWNCAVSHSLWEGMHLFVAQCLGFSLCHQCPGRQQSREVPQLPACGHRSSLSLGKIFKQSVLWQISQKCAQCPAKEQHIPEQGSLYVCIWIYMCAYI